MPAPLLSSPEQGSPRSVRKALGEGCLGLRHDNRVARLEQEVVLQALPVLDRLDAHRAALDAAQGEDLRERRRELTAQAEDLDSRQAQLLGDVREEALQEDHPVGPLLRDVAALHAAADRGDCQVEAFDLALLLGAWGPCE